MTDHGGDDVQWVGGWKGGALAAVVVVGLWAFVSFGLDDRRAPADARPVASPNIDARPLEDANAPNDDEDGSFSVVIDAALDVRARPLLAGPRANSPTALPFVPSANDSATEIDLLARAQEALFDAPDAALALADGDIRRFPQGVLREQAEVLAMEALVRLGRVEEARARARKFKADFPRSAHQSAIDGLLGSKK